MNVCLVCLHFLPRILSTANPHFLQIFPIAGARHVRNMPFYLLQVGQACKAHTACVHVPHVPCSCFWKPLSIFRNNTPDFRIFRLKRRFVYCIYKLKTNSNGQNRRVHRLLRGKSGGTEADSISL